MRLLLLLALLTSSPAMDPLTMSGTVRDATGMPLPGAAIEIDGTLRAVSDDAGEFELSLSSGSRVTLVVTLPGFEPFRSTIDARAGSQFDVVLAVARVEDRVTVTAPAEENHAPFSLTPVQIYRTPGAQADVFRALQALPGVAAADEGAGLFVRGGDVSEVLVSLDDAVVAHPYRYETPTGGFRGAVDPLLVSSLSFASGGFSSRYGNVLSAVVDLRGLERADAAETSATVGLAGASASLAAPLGDRFGARGAVNRTFTRLLFAVNGEPRHFDPAPEGWDASTAITANLGRAGRIKGFGLIQRDSVGVELERDAFVGLLRSTSRHAFVGGRWDGLLGGWAAFASAGADRYERQTDVGLLDMSVVDRVASWRLEIARPRTRGATWRIGANGSGTGTSLRGVVPTRGGDFGGVSGASHFDADVDDWFAGLFVETTTVHGRTAITPGVRIDRFGLARATTADPRLNVRIALGRAQALRLATGVYHQAPAPAYYDRERGASRLPAMQALHYIVGYESGREADGLFLRAEAYVKNYDRLPLQDHEIGYSADGYGSAHGLDLFTQWLSSRLELRASATWLDARRRWTPADERERYEVPAGTWPAAFEIPWSITATANVPIRTGISLGTAWRSAAGRPHTPIVGAAPSGDQFVPVFGAINSKRLPRFERLDVSVNWLVPVGSGVAILFASLDNALGRANVFEYAYARDYSSRWPVTSASPRSAYVGISFTR